jgi:hypothetical protein
MGDEATGADIMRPIHDLGPVMDTFAMVEPLIDAHAEAFEPCLNGRGYLNFTEHRTVRRGSTRTPTASCAR